MCEAGAGRGHRHRPRRARPSASSPPAADRLDLDPGLLRPSATSHLDADAVVLPAHARAHRTRSASSCGRSARPIGDRPDTVVLFELPDVRAGARGGRVLGHLLRALLLLHARLAGPAVPARPASTSLDLWTRLRRPVPADRGPAGAPVARPRRRPSRSRTTSSRARAGGRARSRTATGITVERGGSGSRPSRAGGGRAVIWGAGSKGVAFLTDARRRSTRSSTPSTSTRTSTGKFMAGTGQRDRGAELPPGVRPRAGRRDEPDLPGRDRRHAARAVPRAAARGGLIHGGDRGETGHRPGGDLQRART